MFTKKFISCALICASKQAENTVKKKIKYFKKNYGASLSTFFEIVFAVFKFFTARCLDVKFGDLLYFICLKFNPQYWYFLLRREKMC